MSKAIAHIERIEKYLSAGETSDFALAEARGLLQEAVGVISDQEAMQIKVCALMAQGSYMSAVNLLLEDK